jgi:hypothetical protein
MSWKWLKPLDDAPGNCQPSMLFGFTAISAETVATGMCA